MLIENVNITTRFITRLGTPLVSSAVKSMIKGNNIGVCGVPPILKTGANIPSKLNNYDNKQRQETSIKSRKKELPQLRALSQRERTMFKMKT